MDRAGRGGAGRGGTAGAGPDGGLGLASQREEDLLEPAVVGGAQRGEHHLLAQREASHVLRGQAHLEIVPRRGAHRRCRAVRARRGAPRGSSAATRVPDPRWSAHPAFLRCTKRPPGDHHQAVHGGLAPRAADGWTAAQCRRRRRMSAAGGASSGSPRDPGRSPARRASARRGHRSERRRCRGAGASRRSSRPPASHRRVSGRRSPGLRRRGKPASRWRAAVRRSVSRPVRPLWRARVEHHADGASRVVEAAEVSPPTSARPASARARPVRIRRVVDFPAPLGPRKPVTLPGTQMKLRSSTAARVAIATWSGRCTSRADTLWLRTRSRVRTWLRGLLPRPTANQRLRARRWATKVAARTLRRDDPSTSSILRATRGRPLAGNHPDGRWCG